MPLVLCLGATEHEHVVGHVDLAGAASEYRPNCVSKYFAGARDAHVQAAIAIEALMGDDGGELPRLLGQLELVECLREVQLAEHGGAVDCEYDVVERLDRVALAEHSFVELLRVTREPNLERCWHNCLARATWLPHDERIVDWDNGHVAALWALGHHHQIAYPGSWAH